jgi:hypothetical protein
MRTPDPNNWHVEVVTQGLNFRVGRRRSQCRTIGERVYIAMRCHRVSEADTGCAMATGTAPKHNIKRGWRFLHNQCVEVTEGMRAVACLAAKTARGRLVVAVDGVEVGRCKVLRAAIPLRGQRIPTAFAAYHPNDLFSDYAPDSFETQPSKSGDDSAFHLLELHLHPTTLLPSGKAIFRQQGDWKRCPSHARNTHVLNSCAPSG